MAGIELKRCTSVFDAERRFRPSYDESVTTVFECNTVILAIGQAADLSLLGPGATLNPGNPSTALPGVFAGGDAAYGPGSVIQAIASGRRGAMAIDRYLGGTGSINETLTVEGYGSPAIGRDHGFARQARIESLMAPASDRVADFGLIDRGYAEDQARKEAARCLQCDLRLRISKPVLPPEHWIPITAEKIASVPAADGVYQLVDEHMMVIKISGVPDLRAALEEHLASQGKARFFAYEEERMYTQRESELLQQHLQQHGKLPELNDELDDLF